MFGARISGLLAAALMAGFGSSRMRPSAGAWPTLRSRQWHNPDRVIAAEAKRARRALRPSMNGCMSIRPWTSRSAAYLAQLDARVARRSW